MKHAVKQRKSAVTPKTKSFAPVKAVTKTNLKTKKAVGKVASNNRSPNPVQKVTTAAKIAPKTLSVSAKNSLKKLAPKLSLKTSNALQAVSNRKAKPVVKQSESPKTTKKIASKPSAKPSKALPSKVSVKSVNPTAPKAKPIFAAKKAAAEKRISKFALKQKTTLKTVSAKPKQIVKSAGKIALKTAKPKFAKATVQMTKPISKGKTPLKIEKAKLVTAKPVRKKKTAALILSAKPVNNKTSKITVAEPPRVSKKKLSAKNIVEPKKADEKKVSVKAKMVAEPKKTAAESIEFTPVSATENIVWKRLKIKPAISSAKAEKAKQKIKKEAVIEKTAPIPIIENIKLRPPKPKKGKPIGSAIFRGKKERYDFKVFELNDVFEPIPAVYIISKRKTDRNKRAHHVLICIGATDSVADELKRHRKGKCVKKHSANVVSILPEDNEKMRLKIETDLKAAHAVVCNFE